MEMTDCTVVCRLKVHTILEALMLRCDVFVYNFKHVQLQQYLKYKSTIR